MPTPADTPVPLACRSLDASNAAHLGDFFRRIGSAGKHLLLDLSRVEYVTTAGLGELVLLGRRLKDRGGHLTLSNPRPLVAEILTLTGLNSVFDVRLGPDSSP